MNRTLGPVVPQKPFRRRWLAAAIALTALTAFASPARAGWDDFEFGQKLIEKGYIDLARKVFEQILANDKRPQTERDRAKYGMALLGKAELVQAARNPKTPWKEVVAKMEAALASIEEFATKNANDPHADEARFESGNLRRWFVGDFASNLAQDKQALADRGVTAAEVQSESQKQIDAAIATYKKLVDGAKLDKDKQIANYHYVTANYYRGLVFPKCSTEAKSAFTNAQKILQDYAEGNDGYLTAVFAQDFSGLTRQELGDCADDQDAKWKLYNAAMDDFTSCAGTEDTSEDHRKIIAQGYLHVGQLANHVADGDPPISEAKARDLLRIAKRQLSQMTQRAPRAPKIEAGVLALVEWGLIEWKLDNGGEAIQILKRASDAAQAGGFDGARNRANAALARVVAGGGSSKGGGGADPSVLFKVAEDFFSRGKFAEAATAYQKVLQSAQRTPESLKVYVYPSWARIAQSYAGQKLIVEAAAAYDAIMDEVRAGRIVGGGEGDRTTKLAVDSMEAERKLLSELANKTGDPSFRERFNKFTEEAIAYGKVLNPAGSSGSDLAYKRARELFDGARRAKDENAAESVWKKGFADSRQYFTETAKNLKSEFQDLAWIYLARVAYELGDWDGVIKAADEALAYWETAESKKRAESEEKVGAARKGNMATASYWKAAAYREAKQPAKALEILDEFDAKYGKSAPDFYRGQAMGARVEILADMGRIVDAENALEKLLREVPDYHRIGAILMKVAGYYQAKVAEDDKQIAALNLELLGPPEDRSAGVKGKLATATKREENLVSVLSDLNTTIKRKELFLERADAPEREKQKVEEELVVLRKKRDESKAQLDATRKEIADLTKQRDDLLAKKAALQAEQAPPLRRSADLYRRLDDVLRDLDKAAGANEKKRRKAGSVGELAYRYYRLARIEPDVTEHATRARELYEDFLAFPETQALPESNLQKRNTMRYLGELYYRLAASAKSPEEAKTAYANAVKYLQAGLARNPANTALLVAHISGDLPVLQFADPVTGRKWSIPVRRVADNAAFKDYVKDLGGDRLPRYLNDKTQQEYEKAIKSFQRKIADSPDDEIKDIVKSLKNAGFDASFFGEHADTSSELLLQLARAYASSGVAEHALRGMNVSQAVIDAPPRAEDDSDDWWEAKTIMLDLLVGMAERASASAGADSGDAKNLANRADRTLANIKQMHPRIGGVDRRDLTVKEWKAIQLRLAKAMGNLGLTPKPVDVESVPTEAASPEPAAPPATVPTPTAPAGEPAMADAPGMTEPAPMDGK